MPVPEPFTQSLTLSWLPELRFFERRYEILRALQDRGDMWAFHASDTGIQARLFDLDHQLTVRQHNASLHLLAPAPQADRAWDVFAFAVTAIQPRQAQTMALTFQFVEPLPLDFDAAIRIAHSSLVHIPGTDAIQAGDWALLVDLSVSEPEGADGQTEFGIIKATETAPRLRRDISRVTMAEAPTMVADQWEDAQFAPVSLFVDVTFRAPASPGAGMLDALHGFWNDLRREAGNLVTEVKHRLVPAEKNERGHLEQRSS